MLLNKVLLCFIQPLNLKLYYSHYEFFNGEFLIGAMYCMLQEMTKLRMTSRLKLQMCFTGLKRSLTCCAENQGEPSIHICICVLTKLFSNHFPYFGKMENHNGKLCNSMVDIQHTKLGLWSICSLPTQEILRANLQRSKPYGFVIPQLSIFWAKTNVM